MMSYEKLKELLASEPSTEASSFDILREISNHVNKKETHNEGRDLVIRSLSVVDRFKKSEQDILVSLVRSVGLFPYMKSYLPKADLDDYLAFELHRAENLGSEIIFHSLQSRIYHLLLEGGNVVLSASTSVGKSLVIDALIASGRFRKVVIVVPTIALIDETRKRLARKFSDKCHIITHLSQIPKEEGINVYILTQERVLNREDLDGVDLFIIDEFYKVNLPVDKPDDRAVDLNLAFHKLAKTGSQFYLLGPNIQSIKGLEKYEHHFIPSEFSTVAVDVVSLNLATKGEDRDKKLVDLCQSIDGPTIIYCQSPRSASEVTAMLSEKLTFDVPQEIRNAIDWIGDQYDPKWVVCQGLEKGIGMHHGGVPRALQQYFIRLFNEKKIRFLVCTSTIIEGVNTVAKNVIIYDRRKSTNVLDHFTYKNIEGRAGRMQEYFIGKVYVLEAIPEDEVYSVEFPIGTQGPETPFSLLLDLPANDLTKGSKDRLDEYFKNSSLSQETLRINRHIPLVTQEAVAAVIRADYLGIEGAMNWTGIPNGPQLQDLCNLIFENLGKDLFREYGVFSGIQLAYHINSLRIGKDLSAYVKERVNTRQEGRTESDAVEQALRFIRNVICQKFPRDVRAIEQIQKEIFLKNNKKPGEYTLFADQLENLFLPSALFALDEYGVPIQTVQKLEHLLPDENLDAVLTKLQSLNKDKLQLSPFEKDVLNDVCATI